MPELLQQTAKLAADGFLNQDLSAVWERHEHGLPHHCSMHAEPQLQLGQMGL